MLKKASREEREGEIMTIFSPDEVVQPYALKIRDDNLSFRILHGIISGKKQLTYGRRKYGSFAFSVIHLLAMVTR
jgi:hypothetical protein